MGILSRYYHWLHGKWPAGSVEKLPLVGEQGLTNVPGVRIVGDLSGVPLLKFSSETGTQAVRAIPADPDFAHQRGKDAEVLDVAIIGGGVSGVSAAMEAAKAGLNYRLFEATQLFSTVANFPKAKPIFTYPTEMTPAGGIQYSEASGVKEAQLEDMERQRKEAGVEPVAARIERIERSGGAHDPAELPRLLAPWRAGAQVVLGQRTSVAANWPRLGYARAAFNVLLGTWAGALSGRSYRDLGPFRLIERRVFERIDPRETTWGWTIEPQVVAPRLGVRVAEVSVTERLRIAGEQKVTGVSLAHTLRIGMEIVRAAWRCRFRELPALAPELAAPGRGTAT